MVHAIAHISRMPPPRYNMMGHSMHKTQIEYSCTYTLPGCSRLASKHILDLDICLDFVAPKSGLGAFILCSKCAARRDKQYFVAAQGVVRGEPAHARQHSTAE